MYISSRGALAGVIATILFGVTTPATARAQCTGDCDLDGNVELQELVRMVGCATGSTPERAPPNCAPCLQVGTEIPVTVDHLVAAVRRALGGCFPIPPTIDDVWTTLRCPMLAPGFPRCYVGPGHDTGIRLQRFPSPEAARAELDEVREGRPTGLFHSFPDAAWQFDRGSPPGLAFRNRYHAWVADRWLVVVHSFDDTTYEIAYPPMEVSELVYWSGIRHGLFPAPENTCRDGASCGLAFEQCVAPGDSLGCGFCDGNAIDECAIDADCASLGSAFICRETTSTDCPAACFGSVRRCFPGCASDEDCAEGEICAGDHRCVGKLCASDDDCPIQFECDENARRCTRAACTVDRDCVAGFCVRSLCYAELGTCQSLPP